MKKRLITTLCCLSVIISIFSAMPAFAADATAVEQETRNEVQAHAWQYTMDYEMTATYIESLGYPDKLWAEVAVPNLPGYIAKGWVYAYGSAKVPGTDTIYVYYRGTLSCYIY